MALSFFCDKVILPSEGEVEAVLGKATGMWNGLEQYIQQHGMLKQEWKIYSQKAGWCKKILLGKEERNIIFLYPNEDCFTGVIVFGEAAVQAAKNSALPKEILNKILEAKAYKEGRSFQIEVKSEYDFEIIKKLVDIKIHN